MTLVKALTHAAEGVMRYGGKAVGKAGTSAARKASGSVFMEVARSFIKKSNPAEIQLGKTAEELFLKRFLSLKNIKIDKQIVARLEKLEGMEFLEASKDVLTKAMGIPSNLAPKLKIVSKMGDEHAAMRYVFDDNVIEISKSLPFTRSGIFDALAHELQHAKQGYTIYRSSIASKYFEHMKKVLTNAVRQKAKLGEATMTKAIEEIKILDVDSLAKEMMGVFPEKIAIQKAIKFKKTAPKELKKLLQKDYETAAVESGIANYTRKFDRLKRKVISQMGTLPSDDEMIAGAFFGEAVAHKSGYGIDYWHSLVEQEAYRVGTAAKRAYTRALKA